MYAYCPLPEAEYFVENFADVKLTEPCNLKTYRLFYE